MKQNKKNVRKSRINDFIDAASEIIADKGYERTSVDSIARTLDITSGTMFYHFKTKGDLLEIIIMKGITVGIEKIRASIDVAPKGVLHQFCALVNAHITIIQSEHWHFHRVWMQEWDKLSDDSKRRLHPLILQYRCILDSLLTSLAREGYLRGDILTFRHILLPALNWTTAWVRFPEKDIQTRLAEQICATSLNQPLEEFRALMSREGGADT